MCCIYGLITTCIALTPILKPVAARNKVEFDRPHIPV